MIKEIIENHDQLKNAEVIALCEWGGDLVAIPCNNEMSGYYPRYADAVVIKENVEIIHSYIESLLLINHWESYEVIFATDSWDGFQPAAVENINDLERFIKWIAKYI